MSNLDEELMHPLNSRMLTCPAQGRWTSFQLVDEFGEGRPYSRLRYTVIDSEGIIYNGQLDTEGMGKVDNHFAGPIALMFDQAYSGVMQTYEDLQTRKHYPLPITDLQVRAEHTRHIHKDGSRTQSNPAQAWADFFCQVEVRHLVQRVAHLPPEVERHFVPHPGWRQLMREHGKRGVCLISMKHNVLEVRPLRALRPVLSTDSQFCTLNLYQLAIMATLSYQPFGQQPDTKPVRESAVSFPHKPSVGNWFGDALAKFEEIWKVDQSQAKPYYPLYEDVPYSKRLEIVPFDPELYPVNSPDLGNKQETPAKIHFLDDRSQVEATDTQAFITHNDEVILISVRGTSELQADALRDADALQVPFPQGVGKVHRGFYDAALKAYDFSINYLQKFYIGQKLIICGHSLGGAIALLLSEMLRRQKEYDVDIILYTYGAPRAADATFVQGAANLVHYRTVNHNDPVPSVPGTWLNTKSAVYATGAAITFANVPAGLTMFAAGITNLTGEPYEHHGTLRHFLPLELGGKEKSSILWSPGCDTIKQHAACSLAVQQIRGLPDRPGLLAQAFNAGNHSMVGGYLPGCWAALRRSQESLELKRALITPREFDFLENALIRITDQLREKRKILVGRGRNHYEQDELTASAFSLEVDKVQKTLDRLATLRWQRVTETDVYGSLSHQTEALAETVGRWQAHAENTAAEQLAMAPAPDDDEDAYAILGLGIGVPRPFDIDSIS